MTNEESKKKLCACGCGNEVKKPGNTFLQGHYSKLKNNSVDAEFKNKIEISKSKTINEALEELPEEEQEKAIKYINAAKLRVEEEKQIAVVKRIASEAGLSSEQIDEMLRKRDVNNETKQLEEEKKKKDLEEAKRKELEKNTSETNTLQIVAPTETKSLSIISPEQITQIKEEIKQDLIKYFAEKNPIVNIVPEKEEYTLADMITEARKHPIDPALVLASEIERKIVPPDSPKVPVEPIVEEEKKPHKKMPRMVAFIILLVFVVLILLAVRFLI